MNGYDHPYQSGYAVAPSWSPASYGGVPAFGVAATTPAERQAANDFAGELRNLILTGQPMDRIGQDVGDPSDLPHRPASVPPAIWTQASSYVRTGKTSEYNAARAACPDKACRDALRDLKRFRLQIRDDPSKIPSILGRAPQVPVSAQDIRDYQLVSGRKAHASEVRQAMAQPGWLDTQRQAGELRQTFSLPFDATAVPGFEGAPADQIAQGALVPTGASWGWARWLLIAVGSVATLGGLWWWLSRR